MIKLVVLTLIVFFQAIQGHALPPIQKIIETGQPSAFTTPVIICDDEGGYPPYTFFLEGRWQGIAVDIIQQIFNRNNIPYVMAFDQWDNCMKKMKTGEAHVALTAVYSTERTEYMLYSRLVYSFVLGVWWDKRRFASRPVITNYSDVKKYIVCGVKGYDTAYEKAAGLTKLDYSYFTEAAVMNLGLSTGKCDFHLAGMDIIYGLGALKQIDLSTFDYEVLKEFAPDKYYFPVSNKYPNATKLLQAIDDGVMSMWSDGSMEAIWIKYTGKKPKIR